MKKLRLLLSYFLAMLLAISTSAQSGWQWQNPLPQGNPLYSINFLKNYGWAVGPNGTALHTSDGGATWKPVDLGIRENLNSVYMHDDLMAFMAGDNGLIKLVIERENGFEINHYPIYTTEDLHSVTSYVSAGSSTCPWVVGENGTIFRSNDFWNTWEDQSITNFSNFYSIDNIDCNEAWAVGPDGTCLYTNDGGVSWSFRSIPTTFDLLSVHVGDYDNIRAVGQQANIWHSSNKGASWEKEYEVPGYNLNDVINIDANLAYAVGWDGKILETMDNGQSWEERNSGTTSTLYDVEDQYSYNHVWVSGHYGIILKNSGPGTDFEMQTKGYLGFLHDVEFINENEGWAVGGEMNVSNGTSKGIVLHTTDGGENWEVQLQPNNLLTAVDFINENEGWAVGRDGTIRHTTSGGEFWGTQTSPIGGYLTGVCFVDENNGWIVSRDNWGEIIHTTNGGTTWVKQVNPASNPLHGVFFIDENKGWAAGLDSTVIRTVDGGQNWERTILNISNNFRFAGIFFIDEMNGWIAALHGRILLTDNGGISWQEINTGFDESFNSVYFIDKNNGWASGDQGRVIRTVDGGRTWFSQRSGVSTNYLSAVQFTDNFNGWAVGEGGTIIHTSNGGFTHDFGTFWEERLGLPIYDNEETKSSIEVNVDELTREGYFLTGLEVMLDSILHTKISDLEITLSHNEITSTLVNHVADGGENFLWTTLKDAASKPITDGIAPFSGDYKPYQALSVFNGMDPNGTWTLIIYDSEDGHEGTLNAWGIRPIFEKAVSIGKQKVTENVQKIKLEQNIPNPFSEKTKIKWQSEISGFTQIEIINCNGQEIASLVNKQMPVGQHSVEFDGSHLSPGIYFYQLRVENYIQTKKLIIQK